ncbi:MAG: hypothetical protein GY859_34375, partial [Desulfobacterales bacterium]|nr:hypothetical protein [Desulfobacterales bacterium]
MKTPIVILHLSDLHFGAQSRFAGRNFEELGQRLGRAARDEAKSRGLKERPDLVVVTGDVAQTALGKEYDDAAAFFESLRESLERVPRDRFVFTPGNHDVSWFQCQRVEIDKNEFALTEEKFRKKLNQVKFQSFDAFTRDFLGKPRAETGLALTRGAILHDFPDLMLSVGALNSCEQESHMDKDHLGLVSK